MQTQRVMTRALMAVAIAALAFGLASSMAGNSALAAKLWTAGTSPLLLASMTRKVLAGRLGVDAVAFVAMSAGLLLLAPFDMLDLAADGLAILDARRTQA